MTALTASRANRLRAEMIISGALPATKRPGGKALARKAARTRPTEINDWAGFQAAAAELRQSTASRGAQLWEAIGLAMVRADLIGKDLHARIEALEARLEGKAEPAARAQKSLRLSLVGDIRRDRVQSLIDRIKEAPPDTPLRVTIDSRGGNLNAAFDLADVIGRHRGDTHCHALQDCSSASVVVMLAAKKRTAEPRCHFTLHRPSLARRPSVLADERIEGMLDNSAHSMARMLASRTGTDAEVFKPMLATARGKRLTSAEAVEYGIIHGLNPIKGRKAK